MLQNLIFSCRYPWVHDAGDGCIWLLDDLWHGRIRPGGAGDAYHSHHFLLVIWCFAFGFQDNFHTFTRNMYEPVPIVESSSGTVLSDNVGTALFFGYCSALLVRSWIV